MKRYPFSTRPLRAITHNLAAGLLLSVLVFPLSWAGAHPHVFANQRLNIVFDNKGLAGIDVRREEFDEMFASMIAEYNDLNGNGRFEPQEVQSVKENAFDYIKEHSCFTFIKIDDSPFSIKFITNFNAVLEKDRLI